MNWTWGAGALALFAAAPGLAQQVAEPSIVAEARAFMAAFERERRTGDRTAIAERYDLRGALIQGNSASRMESARATRGFYLEDWQPYSDFAWDDLHFEALGPDAVLVGGRFLYERPGSRPGSGAYTALLLRRDGRLRIRVEHQSDAPE